MPPPPPPPPLALLPPQLSTPPVRAMRSRSNPGNVLHLRRRAGMPKSRMQARTVPPAEGQKSLNCLFRAVAAVVFTVSETVSAVVPLIVIDAGTLHVGGLLAAAGVIEQLKPTVPVKSAKGATVIVEVFPVVAPGVTETPAPVKTEK